MNETREHVEAAISTVSMAIIVFLLLVGIKIVSAQTDVLPQTEIPVVQEIVTDEVSSLLISSENIFTEQPQGPPVEIPVDAVDNFISPLSLNAKTIRVADVPVLQDEFYTAKGFYQQVRDTVNVYQSPRGWGYQTIEKTPNEIIYIGFGADAEAFTYSIPIVASPAVASSSRNI